jgi:NAD(P)-dependent dehydrogenase (short-subunit alcohol dehydrogenase family)
MKKSILITGASSGIGKVVGEYLSERGHNVVGTSRTPNPDTGNYELIKLDVTDEESINQACERVLAKFKKIDVLINNAGYGICHHKPLVSPLKGYSDRIFLRKC